MDRPLPPLDVRGLTASRPGGFQVCVESLRLSPGEVVAVCGPSGSGKSTLLQALVEHTAPGDPLTRSGRVEVLGQPWPAPGTDAWREALRGPVCIVPQDAIAALDPLRRLGEQISALAGCGSDAVVAALGQLGVEAPHEVAGRYAHEVSGGQAQRALLAVALLRRAGLCLLDEPSAGLDRARIDDLVQALAGLCDGEARTGLLVATHDRALVEALGARAMRIEDGALAPGLVRQPDWPTATPAGQDAPIVASCSALGVRAGRSWLVEHCDLSIHRGENVALLGPSGAGKSTVGRALAGLVRVAVGQMTRPSRPRAVQMLFQDAAGSLTPTRTLRSLIEEVAESGFDVATEAGRLGLGADRLDRPTATLSGGERRRGALLRALSVRPELVILDEPTAALDRQAGIRVVELLLDVRERTGAAMLWITHDDALARAVCHRVVTISGGRTCSRP